MHGDLEIAVSQRTQMEAKLEEQGRAMEEQGRAKDKAILHLENQIRILRQAAAKVCCGGMGLQAMGHRGGT